MVKWRAITIVFPFDKSLPLTKPLHADAVYDRRRLVLLECFVELLRRERQEAQEVGEEEPVERRGKGWVSKNEIDGRRWKE